MYHKNKMGEVIVLRGSPCDAEVAALLCDTNIEPTIGPPGSQSAVVDLNLTPDVADSWQVPDTTSSEDGQVSCALVEQVYDSTTAEEVSRAFSNSAPAAIKQIFQIESSVAPGVGVPAEAQVKAAAEAGAKAVNASVLIRGLLEGLSNELKDWVKPVLPSDLSQKSIEAISGEVVSLAMQWLQEASGEKRFISVMMLQNLAKYDCGRQAIYSAEHGIAKLIHAVTRDDYIEIKMPIVEALASLLSVHSDRLYAELAGCISIEAVSTIIDLLGIATDDVSQGPSYRMLKNLIQQDIGRKRVCETLDTMLSRLSIFAIDDVRDSEKVGIVAQLSNLLCLGSVFADEFLEKRVTSDVVSRVVSLLQIVSKPEQYIIVTMLSNLMCHDFGRSLLLPLPGLVKVLEDVAALSGNALRELIEAVLKSLAALQSTEMIKFSDQVLDQEVCCVTSQPAETVSGVSTAFSDSMVASILGHNGSAFFRAISPA